MDEYSKTGASLYAAIAKRRAQEQIKLMQDALTLQNEADFVEFLREKLGVTPTDPGYLTAITLWRERRP
jgi:hypothetical protein